ncbi:hypothetical protein EON65_40505 [archaeon]|nr:MAG: hypothetical protein EON65_40505 [archaeon]
MSTSQHSPCFNANRRYRQSILDSISIAVFEQDRRFYTQETHTLRSEGKESTVYDVLDVMDILLNSESHTGDQDKYEMFFIFIVEYCYRSLVQQLRSLLHLLLVQDSEMLSSAVSAYQNYLTARQAAGNLPSRHVRRYSWAHVAAETVPDVALGKMVVISTDQAASAEGAASRYEEESKLEDNDQTASSISKEGSDIYQQHGHMLPIRLSSVTHDTHDYNQAATSKLKEMDTSMLPTDERLEDLLTPILPHSQSIDSPRLRHTLSPVASNAEQRGSPASMLSSVNTGRTSSRVHRLRQEELAKEYIKCIEVMCHLLVIPCASLSTYCIRIHGC